MNPILSKFIEDKQREDHEAKMEHAKWLKDFDDRQTQAKQELFPCLRKATKHDYEKWLEGFIKSGKMPSHYYDYPFDRWDNFYVATKDFKTIALCGASSINIIIPIGIKYLGGGIGHINLFFMEEFCANGTVPVFNDVVI